ncbi:MAG: hypothetical protein WD766_12510 [Gemmatimonadota bacterium]
MYLILLTLSLLGGLSVARRIVEPSCPSCAGKSWVDHPPHLQCTSCGWSTAPLPAVSLVEEERSKR